MSTKQFRVSLDCQCEGCPRDFKGYVRKIKGFWDQLLHNASLPSKKPHQCCQCSEKIPKYLKNVQGVDEVAVDLMNDIVTVKGNFDEKDVINCFWEKMAKKAQVVDHLELGKHNLSENGCYDKPRCGRRYGEIEELW